MFSLLFLKLWFKKKKKVPFESLFSFKGNVSFRGTGGVDDVST